MKCSNCKAENSKSRKFCRECGARLVKVCDLCGYENGPDDKFCGDCAKQLKTGFKIKNEISKIESERKNVTVLFSDLSGYTRLSERLDPEKVKEITNQIFNNISRIIIKYNGFVERVFGDEVLAFFGVPKSYEDHPLCAILAAREIHDLVKCMSLELEEETGQILRMHTGINTGLVVTGNTDVTKGKDGFSGQTINIASRLTDMAGPDEILIGPNTYHKTWPHIISEPVTPEITGLNNYEVAIYRVIEINNKSSRFHLDLEHKLTPFVGRGREFSQLKYFLRQSQTGRPMAVSIVSKPGEGKSRLLYEFRKTLTNIDAIYLEGKCFSFHSNTAYYPVISILKEYFGIIETDDDSVVKRKVKKSLKLLDLPVSSTIPYILQLLSVKPSSTKGFPLKLEDLKDQIARVVRQIIINGSKKQLIILAIKDLHWIDKSSEEYFEQMLSNLPEAKVFIIFTYRAIYVPPWNDKFKRYEITLRPLNNRNSLTMVRNLLGTKRLDSNLAKIVLEKTEGVPLFIEEFIRSLLNKNKIYRRGKTSHLEGDLHSLAIPSTIQDIIAARIDSLPKGVKEVLQAGSVAGKMFNYDIIKWVTDLPEEDLLIYLSALSKNQFLYLTKSDQRVQYHFEHSLIQEVSYTSMLVSKRKEIHYKFAAVIEKHYFQKLDQFYEVLAYHYSRSVNKEKAYHYLILSGKKATLSYSNREAFHFFKSAAELLENSESKEKKIEAFKLALIPMVRLGYPEDSLKILNEGADLSKEVNDLESLAKFLDVIGNYYTAKGGNPLLGIKYSEQCLREVEKIQDLELIARVARGLCGSYIVVGEPLKSVRLAGKVIELLEQQLVKRNFVGGELSILPVLRAILAHSLGWLGNFGEGKRWAEMATNSENNTENLYDQAYIHFLCGYLYVHSGEGKKVIEHFNECIHYCEEGKVILWIGLGWTGLGVGYFFSEDLKSAKKYILKGIKLQKESKIPYYLSFHLHALGLVYYESKELSRSRYFFESSLKLSEKYGEKWIEGSSKVFLGNIFNKLNKKLYSFEEAEALTREGIKILEDRKILPWSSVGYYVLGQLYSYNGRPERAVEYLNKAENLFNEMRMEYWLKRTQKALKEL